MTAQGCQSAQNADNQTHRNRSATVSCGSTTAEAKPSTPEDPQEPISDRQLRPLHRPLQNSELMTKGKNIKRKRRAIAKKSQENTRQRNQGRGPSESREERQHPNLSATSRFARTTVEKHKKPPAGARNFRPHHDGDDA